MVLNGIGQNNWYSEFLKIKKKHLDESKTEKSFEFNESP